MSLLVFFAIPLAVILLSIVLQKILNNPILVAITVFAIGLIVVFSLFALGIITDLGSALVALIIYTIIAFVTAYIVRLIKAILDKLLNCNHNCNSGCCHENSCDNNDANLLTINCRCNNGDTQDLLTINSNCGVLGESDENDDNNGGDNCCCHNNNQNSRDCSNTEI